ncbi:MAG: hypothetical protein AAGK47_07460 [Bacteroidota bacterium]
MKWIIYILTTFLLASCAAPEKDYEGMATELCQCMTPLAKLYQEVMTARAQQDTTTVQQLVVQFEQLSKEGADCAERLEDKYGDFVGDEEEKAKRSLYKQCPEIAQMLEQSPQ